MTEHKINLAACNVSDVLMPSPIGHRGMWAQQETPVWNVGDTLVFTVYGDVEKARGKVTSIEAAGTPTSMESWKNWHRTFWEEGK